MPTMPPRTLPRMPLSLAFAAAVLAAATLAVPHGVRAQSPGGPGGTAVAQDALDPTLRGMRLGALEDRDVYGANGEEVGEIDRVVSHGGQLYAVFDSDRMFDTSDRDFLIPLTHFRMVDNRLTLPMTDDQLDALAQGDGFGALAEDMTVGDWYDRVR